MLPTNEPIVATIISNIGLMVVIDRIAKDASTEKGTNTYEPITDVMNKPNNP